jgi:hypothetical protein
MKILLLHEFKLIHALHGHFFFLVLYIFFFFDKSVLYILLIML